jgi:hypothetical protein
MRLRRMDAPGEFVSVAKAVVQVRENVARSGQSISNLRGCFEKRGLLDSYSLLAVPE